MPPKKSTTGKRKAKASAATSGSSKRNKRSGTTATKSKGAKGSRTAAAVDVAAVGSKATGKRSSSSTAKKTPKAVAAATRQQKRKQKQKQPPTMTTTKVASNETTTSEEQQKPQKKSSDNNNGNDNLNTIKVKKISPLIVAADDQRKKSWFETIDHIQSTCKIVGIWCLQHIPLLLVLIMLVFSNLPDDHHLDQDPPLLIAIALVWYAGIRLWSILSEKTVWFRKVADPVVWALLSLALWVVQHITLLAGLVLVIFSFMPEDHHLELDPPMMLAILGVWYMVQSFWSGLPDWLVEQRDEIEDDMDKNENENNNNNDTETTIQSRGITTMKGIGAGKQTDQKKDEDLTSPNTIWKKLNEMFELTYEHTDDIPLPRYKVYLCFFSLMHLLTELYLAEPEWHDDMMRAEGNIVSIKELQTLALYLDLADLAYNESCVAVMAKLRKKEYDLVRHDVATEPGRVGHFIAVNHAKKEVVISIKGTSSLSDVLTDLVGKAVPHTLPDGTEIRCHEGMYNAANLLLEDTRHLIEHFFAPQGYKVVLCGHSLGAGVSTLLGVFLKSYLPDNIQNLQVYAFATPACLNYEASLACQDYITSVINNDDCVPRISLVTIRNLMKVFLSLDGKLTELGRSPTSWRATRAYMSDIAKIDTDTLVTAQELLDFEEAAREDDCHEHALFVPGRVVSMWQHDHTNNNNKTVDSRQLHGGLSTLRHIEVSTTMISDHGTANYKSTLSSLIGEHHDGSSS